MIEIYLRIDNQGNLFPEGYISSKNPNNKKCMLKENLVLVTMDVMHRLRVGGTKRTGMVVLLNGFEIQSVGDKCLLES